MKKHRPPQITQGGETTYFISARTYGGIPYLSSPEKKNIFKEIFFKKTEKFSGEIKHWIVLSNHYHLLIEFLNGLNLPIFIKELHGTSSFLIKKLPIIEVLNEEQIAARNLTPIEERMDKRITELWRRLKPAKTNATVVAGFSPRTQTVVADFSPHSSTAVLANFSLRLEEALKILNFSQEVMRRLKSANTNKLLINALIKDDFLLFKTLIFSSMPEIPFWHNYYSHIIRDEKDYFQHFNYITQNPIKHGLVKNLWDYSFSGVFIYDNSYIIDVLREYPIIDFGGDYE